MSSPFEIQLDNGYIITSGWHDADDPDALPAGDWLSVEDENGVQIFYEDAADILADPIEGRKKLYAFLLACRGEILPGSAVRADRRLL